MPVCHAGHAATTIRTRSDTPEIIILHPISVRPDEVFDHDACPVVIASLNSRGASHTTVGAPGVRRSQHHHQTVSLRHCAEI
jgi:hypothetical protein